MRIIPIALVLLTLPAHGLAQDRRAVLPSTTRPSPTPVAPSTADLAPAAAGGVLDHVFRLVGGALAGAWVGYMASQVAVSDWDDHNTVARGSWAGAGAAFGMAMGLTLPTGRAPRAPGEPRARSTSRDVLQWWEIREAQVENLYELIQSERPEWLRTRGTASMRETPRGRSTGDGPGDLEIEPGIGTIRVYLDDALLGGVDKLRELQPGEAGEIRRLDRAEATQRWGAGHLHGAIQVVTAPAEPE